MNFSRRQEIPQPLYHNRDDAGCALAANLRFLCPERRLLVLALPRGGVPVASAIAEELGAPLDVFTVRKLGVPGHPEFAMGALATGGTMVLNNELIQRLNIPMTAVEDVVAREQETLLQREHLYRHSNHPPELSGRTVILVDDGIATGATMSAAVNAARTAGAARVIVAAPIGSPDAVRKLGEIADEVYVPVTPPQFDSVGQWYEDFHQISDDEVRNLVRSAQQQLHLHDPKNER